MESSALKTKISVCICGKNWTRSCHFYRTLDIFLCSSYVSITRVFKLCFDYFYCFIEIKLISKFKFCSN